MYKAINIHLIFNKTQTQSRNAETEIVFEIINILYYSYYSYLANFNIWNKNSI